MRRDMNPYPLVSIVIPAYNTEEYLPQCLSSVQGQTLDNIEIICVNDGSTDGTAAIIKDAAAQDGRIKVIDKQSNEGYGKALNDGLRIAGGEYLGIVESDDFVDPDMFESLYGLAHAGFAPPIGADVVKCAWHLYNDEAGDYLLIDPYADVPQDAPVNIKESHGILIFHPSIWAGIYRIGFLRQKGISWIEYPGAGWVDNPFLIQCLYLADSLIVTSQTCYHYRHMREGSSSEITDCTVPLTRINEMLDFLESQGDSSIVTFYVYWRALIYLMFTQDSAAYPEQERMVLPIIEKTMRRIDPKVLENDLLPDEMRARYEDAMASLGLPGAPGAQSLSGAAGRPEAPGLLGAAGRPGSPEAPGQREHPREGAS